MTKRKVFPKIAIALVVCCLLGAASWLWYDNNVDRSGWREKDGTVYYTDFHGRPVSGWLEIDGGRYYFGEDHAPVTAWQEINGRTHYFSPDGRLAAGWHEIGGSRYYLDSEGSPVSGWLELDELRYYLDESGILQTGWLRQEEGSYYLGENGATVTGWLELEDASYYFAEDGIMATGWTELEDGIHYFQEDGSAAEGWLDTEDGRCRFGELGVPLTGWQEIDDSRYYFAENGIMVTGWQKIGESRYYFDEDGAMHFGWLELGEYRYYLKEDGTMAVGPTQIGERTYHFTPEGIYVLLVNRWNPLPDDYEVSLVTTERNYQIDESILEAFTEMFEACRAAGLYPTISSAYRSKADQQRVWKNYVEIYMEQGFTEDQANAATAAFVAVPGASEHHLGLALDLVGMDYYEPNNRNYANATANVHAWLREHCWEYGFIHRYQENKQSITGYIAEAWHFRYVGTEVSMAMKDSGLCLEEYLGAAEH